MSPNETDVQFLARMMLGAHVPAGVSAGDSSRLYELAYPDTPAPVEERESVIPEGAEEFTSDGMRALRFVDSMDFEACVRVPNALLYEYRAGKCWLQVPRDKLLPSLAPAHPWLLSVWAEMRDEQLNIGLTEALELLRAIRKTPGANRSLELVESIVEKELAHHAAELKERDARIRGLESELELAWSDEHDPLKEENEKLRTERDAALAKFRGLQGKLQEFRNSLVTIDIDASKQTEDLQDSLAAYFDELFPDPLSRLIEDASRELAKLGLSESQMNGDEPSEVGEG